MNVEPSNATGAYIEKIEVRPSALYITPSCRMSILPHIIMAKSFIVVVLFFVFGLILSSPAMATMAPAGAPAGAPVAAPAAAPIESKVTTEEEKHYELGVPLFRHRDKPGTFIKETEMKSK